MRFRHYPPPEISACATNKNGLNRLTEPERTTTVRYDGIL